MERISAITRSLLACGAIAPVLFVVTFFIDGATRAGYDPWRNFVSQLSTGERGWMQIVNFEVCGALLLAGTVGLWRDRASRIIALLVGVFAIGLLIAGAFVTDPAFGYPPGEREPPRPTFHDTIHGFASIVAFVVLGVTPLAGLVAAGQQHIVTADAAMGALQRVSVVAGFAWLSVCFLRSLKVNAR